MPKLISLYTGAGGLDLGFESAGFRTAVAVEMDQEAITTLRKNRDWPVLDRDIHAITSKEILRAGSLKVSEADVLIGGPPCQPFSKSGYWASGDTLRLDDPRAGTLWAYLRVLRDTLPKAFLLENVPGLVFRRKSEGLDLVKTTLDAINKDRGTNYTFSLEKLNAAHYGVPQLRERVLIIGSRDGLEFKFPRPTHGETDGIQLTDLKRLTTAWDAIGDLEADDTFSLRLRGKWADLLPSIPEGENYLWHTDRGGGRRLFGWRRRYWNFLLKLSKNMPSWTVQAQPGPASGPFHWMNRRLSARELCRIQTIPDDYQVVGNLFSVQRQIGNAVPSALAEVMARAIRCQLLADKVDSGSALIPTPRHPVPLPEPIKAVPRKYRSLVGDHEEHPGTGQGFAAKCRRVRATSHEKVNSRD